MKPTADLLSTFDDCWKNFSDAWKKARAKSSEKSIHALRVNTRRMIAALELTKGLSRRPEVTELQRKFKKVLKSMGPLRDTQVLLENITALEQGALILDFKKVLERRERRKIDRVRSNLKRGTKQRLSKGMKAVRSEFGRLHDVRRPKDIERFVERVLASRRNEFVKAERRFQKLQPHNDELLHAMRIALKKLRYVVEAAQPVLGEVAKRQARDMQDFQQLIGESRDLEMLRAALEKWAEKNGKKIAIVPELDRLQEKREALLKKIVASSREFEAGLRSESVQPVTERTEIVSARAAAVGATS